MPVEPASRAASDKGLCRKNVWANRSNRSKRARRFAVNWFVMIALSCVAMHEALMHVSASNSSQNSELKLGTIAVLLSLLPLLQLLQVIAVQATNSFNQCEVGIIALALGFIVL